MVFVSGMAVLPETMTYEPKPATPVVAAPSIFRFFLK
jgi:hypothetical protein